MPLPSMFTECVTFFGSRGEWSTCSTILDTGASHSILPTDVAERIGVVRDRTMNVTVADGVVEMGIGQASIAVGRMPAEMFEVFLGPPGDGGVVGMDVIRAFRLLVRPSEG